MPIIRLYIDPATGSMLFSVLLGVFISAGFFLRMLLIKIKTVAGGKSAAAANEGNRKFVLYTDDKRYWNNFKPILDEFEKRKIKVSYWTSSQDDPVFSQEYEYVDPEFIGEGNKAFVRLNAAMADVLLTSTPGLDVLQWKRSKGVKKYVHFFHAADSAISYRMFQIDFFDSLLTVSDFQTEEVRKIEQLRKLPAKDIKVVGLPYFDVLKDRLSQAGFQTNTNKVILLAPSWGKSGLLYVVGEKLIDALIKTGYEIVFRPHPQSYTADKEILDKIREDYGNCPNFSWNSDNDNFEILRRADLLISDFSGVFFDFALVFGKPIMYTPISDFDDSIYDSAWVDDELWKFKVLPTIGAEVPKDRLDDIKSTIDEVLSSNKYEKGIREAQAFGWKNQGHAAESITDYLIDLQAGLNSAGEAK